MSSMSFCGLACLHGPGRELYGSVSGTSRRRTFAPRTNRSSRMYCFIRRLGKRFCAWEALKFLLGCDGGVESVLTARKISPCRMTIHARRHEQGIHRQLTACSDVLPLSQTASVPYLGVRIYTILVALLSKNTPYEASLVLFAVRVMQAWSLRR